MARKDLAVSGWRFAGLAFESHLRSWGRRHGGLVCKLQHLNAAPRPSKIPYLRDLESLGRGVTFRACFGA